MCFGTSQDGAPRSNVNCVYSITQRGQRYVLLSQPFQRPPRHSRRHTTAVFDPLLGGDAQYPCWPRGQFARVEIMVRGVDGMIGNQPRYLLPTTVQPLPALEHGVPSFSVFSSYQLPYAPSTSIQPFASHGHPTTTTASTSRLHLVYSLKSLAQYMPTPFLPLRSFLLPNRPCTQRVKMLAMTPHSTRHAIESQSDGRHNREWNEEFGPG